MEVFNAIVHELIKQRHVRGAAVHPAPGEMVKNEALTSLLRQVLNSYNSRCSRHTGSFEEDVENYRFSVALRTFLDDDAEFVRFSLTAMERLRVKMNDITFAAGGYLMFIRYHHDERDMLLVAKLSPETGSIFSHDLHEVVESQYLNIDRLQVAARVDLNAWHQGGERYLTFVLKQDQGNPSDYFREFIGCRIDQDSRLESKKLVKVVMDFATKQADEGAITPDMVPDVQRRAFDYAEEIRRLPTPAPVSFDALANTMWPDDPEVFLRFLNEHPEQPSAGFIPDRTTFKKLANISYRSRELSMKMTYQFKQQHVRTEGRRVVIEEAPERLIKELTEG